MDNNRYKDIPPSWNLGQPPGPGMGQGPGYGVPQQQPGKEYEVFHDQAGSGKPPGVYPAPPWVGDAEAKEQYQKFRFDRQYHRPGYQEEATETGGKQGYGDVEVYKTATPKPPHISPLRPISEPGPGPAQPIKKLNVLGYLGMNPEIPTLMILKISSIVLLILCVELNMLINLTTLHPELVKIWGDNVEPFIGVSLIGVFLGILFKYSDFELKQLKFIPVTNKRKRYSSYLTLIFLITIAFLITIIVIIELVNARQYFEGAKAGTLFILDLLAIFIVMLGTYAIFSKNKGMVLVAVFFLLLIMFMGIDFGQDLISMVLLGAFLVLYIEITDGAIRLNEYVDKFYEFTKVYDHHGRAKFDINTHMESISNSYTKTLAMFFILTLLITGILLMIFVTYPYVTPEYMHENLEAQTVYALVPIIMLLVLIFLAYYILTKYVSPLFTMLARR